MEIKTKLGVQPSPLGQAWPETKKNAADRDMHYTQPWPSAGAWKAKTTKEDVDSEFGLLSSVSSRVKVRIGTRMSARLC